MHWKLLPILLGSLFVGLAAAQDATAPKTQAGAGGADPLFQDLPVVEAASLHMQTLEQAPGSVTVISATDIRTYGYRTLADALASVRGFDVTYDRMYHYLGVQGFSLPGDYNTRVIVLLNGHPLTEIVYDSANYFGQDFGLDMDLVQRIEIVRGPSSALYGSNGVFATINVITKSPVDQDKARVSMETDSFGERKLEASSSAYLGRGANLLVAASVFNNAGQNFYIPEFANPATNNGMAIGTDDERGYHTFANLIWRDWSVTAYVNSRQKFTPLAYDVDAQFDNRGSFVQDQRDFVRVAHSSNVGSTGQLRFEFSYDHYAYDDRFFYPSGGDLQDVRNVGRGDWIEGQVTYSFALVKLGQLTVGTQGDIELRNLQVNAEVKPVYSETLRVSRPDQKAAFFAQQEWEISSRWKAYLGLRYDISRNFQSALSPRLAVVYQRSARTVYKLVYGHPFRNPSAYEQYYADNLLLVAAQPLRPETAHTFEATVERKLGRRLNGIVNAYDYQIHDLIQTVALDPESNLQQYQNIGSARSNGLEFELSGKPAERLELGASFTIQRTVDGVSGAVLPNSPERVAKLRLATPLIRRKLMLSTSSEFVSPRQTIDGYRMRSVLLWDATASTDKLWRHFEASAGVRNLLDWRYSDPTQIVVDSLAQDGRSVFLQLVWRPVE